MTIVKVTVAILTYLRPDELRAHLPPVLAQAEAINATDQRFQVDVVVIDNDPEGSACATVGAIGSALVRYVVEPRPGISAARNRALDEAVGSGSRLLVFIDDDERPEPEWLISLLEVWSDRGRPAVVSGRVVPEYASPPDPWIEAGRFFRRRSLPTGTALDVAASNNLLLDLDQIRAHGVRFEDRYGLAGGEDTLFTRQLHAAGAPMLWCDESVVVDKVPTQRMAKGWILRRAFSHGNSTGLISIELAGPGWQRIATRVRVGAGGAARVFLGALRWLLGRLNGSLVHQARGSRMMWRGRGMLSAALGTVYQEYRRD